MYSLSTNIFFLFSGVSFLFWGKTIIKKEKLRREREINPLERWARISTKYYKSLMISVSMGIFLTVLGIFELLTNL